METINYPTKSEITAGTHISYWTDSQPDEAPFHRPATHLQADVVIVGGGISGLSVAYCLSKAGKKVVVVEDGHIGSGETGRTTAHLVTALDDRYYELERIYGKEKTRLIAESHAAAIRFIEDTVRLEGIDCDFRHVDGYLFLHPSDDPENLAKELEACRQAGLQVEYSDAAPGIRGVGRSIRFPRQAQFHPLRYLDGLHKAIVALGGQVFTGTHAQEIGKDHVVTTDGIRMDASHIVVATNSPVNNKVVTHLTQYAYRTYVIGALVPKDSIPAALWWDTGDFEQNQDIPPYHYVRTQPYNDIHDLLICGGEDHAVGLADAQQEKEEDNYAQLEGWMRAHFTAGEIVYRWSGQVLEPMDGLAYIGKNPHDGNEVYIVSGDSGNGMTHGTIAGMLLTDLITGKENPWEALYNPMRFTIHKTGLTLVREFFGGLLAYLKYNPKDTDAVQIAGLPQGEGIIVKLKGEKHGVYRDEKNRLHLVSALCPHQQCTVKFNADEKSWDCPCHGSRFTYEGRVMNGPANKDLGYTLEEGLLNETD